MIAALIASIAANVALVFLFSRQLGDARAQASRDAARAAHDNRLERAVLLQRIQAPEQAIQDHAIASAPVHAPQAVSLFDDQDHWGAQGLTLEQLADLSMEQELNAHA